VAVAARKVEPTPQELPAMPGGAAKLLAALGDERSSATTVARLIARDQGLATTVLRAANSAFYRSNREVRDVTTALVVVGFDSVRMLLVGRLARLAHGPPDPVRDRLWRHALAVALASQACARALRGVSPSYAFTCGLLHDVGKAVLYLRHGAAYSEVLDLAGRFECGTDELERDRWQVDHGSVGADALAAWQLPPEAEAAARFHHDLAAAAAGAPAHARLCRMVALADAVATWKGYGSTPAGAGAEPPLDAPALDALGAPRAMVETLGSAVTEQLEGMRDVFA